jgi:hypothetical protein
MNGSGLGPPAVIALTVQRNSASLTEAVATRSSAAVANSATPSEAFSRCRRRILPEAVGTKS